MLTKICSKCSTEKPLDEFHKSSDSKDGRYPSCIQCKKAYHQQYYQENKDKFKQRYEENREEMLEKARVYREENRELIREIAREWAANNKEKRNATQAKRKARLKENGGSHSLRDVCEIYIFQEGKCKWCSILLQDDMQKDHIIPICQGGGDEATNICLSCPPCNLTREYITQEI